MKTNDLTEEEYLAAVRELEQAGVSPSYRAIRRHAGKGSMTTINVLKKKFAGETARQSEETRQACLALWDLALKEARTAAKNELLACEQNIDQLAVDHDTISRENETLVAELDSTKKELNRVQGELTNVLRQILDLENKHAKERNEWQVDREGLREKLHLAELNVARLSPKGDGK